MAKTKQPPDSAFAIGFYETVLRINPAYTEVIEMLGGLYTKTGRITDGLRMDRRLVRLQPDNATAHYNLACSLALCRRKSDSLASLRRAVALGYRDFKWMSQDPDLGILEPHPQFKALLETVRQLQAVERAKAR